MSLFTALGQIAADGWRLAANGIYHGSLLALVTLLLTVTVLRRARPALLAALWTIVLCKFVVPIGPELSFSLNGLADRVLGTTAGSLTAPAVPAGAPVPAPLSSLGSTSDQPWLPLALLAAYGLALTVLVTRRLRAHHRQRREVAALAPACPQILRAAQRAAGRLGLSRLPEVRESERPCTPLIFGVLTPVLVVPTRLTDAPDRLEAALLHELAHLKRGDHWLRWVQIGVGTLLFFWPVVAWVNRRVDCAREMACDQWAISCGRLSPAQYAQLLLGMVGAGRPAAPAGLALSWPPSQLARRVAAVLSRPRRRTTPAVGLATGVGLALWGLVSLGGAARAESGSDRAQLECLLALRDLDPGLAARLLAAYPEADRDGDGALTRYEICAHQERLKRQIVDQAFDSMDPEMARDVASWLDPEVDRDGDGVLSEAELDALKDEVVTSVRSGELALEVEFPGQVCEEPPVSCVEAR